MRSSHYKMHQKKWLRLLSTQATQKYLTAFFFFFFFNCIGSEEDCLALQGTLSNMEHWSKVNNIYFNASKCKALSATRKRKPLCYSYNLDGVHLTRAAEVKDLGVTITSSLSWDTHIHDIVAKANNLPRLNF